MAGEIQVIKSDKNKQIVPTSGVDISAIAMFGKDRISEIFNKERIKFERRSKKPTPKIYLDTKESYTFIKRHYMRNELSRQFPFWSLEILDKQVIGIPKEEWMLVTVRLHLIDENGIKTFCDMMDGHRIQHVTEPAPTQTNPKAKRKLDGFVNLGSDCKAAVVDAFKKAVNFKTGIGDDIYKYIDEEMTTEYSNIFRKVATLAKEDDYPQALQAFEDDMIDMSNIKDSMAQTMSKLSEESCSKIEPDELDLINFICGIEGE